MEIKHIQGSDEWLLWRKSKITASILPIILGKSPYCSKYLLWQRMLGFAPEQKQNWAMKRGNDLEPMVRDLANIELDCKFVPMVVQHDELEWAAASLDGIYKNSILEIKCPGLADHKEAEAGNVPVKYAAQVQWQLFCSNLKTCYYVSYFEEAIVTVKVERDDDYIAKELLPAASEFYRCLIDMIEPELSEKDYVQIVDEGFEEFANDWKTANKNRKQYEKEEKGCRNEMIKYTDDSNCKGFGVKLTRCSREGKFDFDSFYEQITSKYPGILTEFPLEQFKKEQIGYWKVSEDKGSD